MNILERTQIEKLPTARLLALYRKTRGQMSRYYAWVTDYGNMPEALNEDNNEVKQCLELNRYCDELKSVLDTREHVERRKK